MTEEISEDHCKFEMTIPAIVRPPTPPPPPKECDTTVEVSPISGENLKIPMRVMCLFLWYHIEQPTHI